MNRFRSGQVVNAPPWRLILEALDLACHNSSVFIWESKLRTGRNCEEVRVGFMRNDGGGFHLVIAPFPGVIYELSFGFASVTAAAPLSVRRRSRDTCRLYITNSSLLLNDTVSDPLKVKWLALGFWPTPLLWVFDACKMKILFVIYKFITYKYGTVLFGAFS